MAKRLKTVGTGITQKDVTEYSGADLKAGADDIFGGRAGAVDEAGGDFGAVTLDAVKLCRRLLAITERKNHPRDSEQWFAQQIVPHFDIAAAAIKRGDADFAARFGFDMGVLLERARMKFRWEADALRGQNHAKFLADARNQLNNERKKKTEAEHRRWNDEAAKIWAGKPKLSGAAVAKSIKTRLGVDAKPGTIADIINKNREK